MKSDSEPCKNVFDSCLSVEIIVQMNPQEEHSPHEINFITAFFLENIYSIPLVLFWLWKIEQLFDLNAILY